MSRDKLFENVVAPAALHGSAAWTAREDATQALAQCLGGKDAKDAPSTARERRNVDCIYQE
eukprot:7698407-Pyramimonas_sp.AAC.1